MSKFKKALQAFWAAQKRAAQRVKRTVGFVIAATLLVALLVGGAFAMSGLAMALLVIAGAIVTAQAIPGFWWFAATDLGYIVVVVGTAMVTHALFGAATITGIFAIGWTLVLKMLILSACRRRIRQGRDPNPVMA